MPTFDAHPANNLTKVLIIGDSKSGKTGSLLSLILAGYNLRVLDYDNGIDILINLLKVAIEEKKLTLEQAQQRFRYYTLTDKFKNKGGQAVPDGVPTAFPKGQELLTRWKEPSPGKDAEGTVIPGEDLGPLEQWTSQDIICIDTLNFMGRAALNYVKAINGRSAAKPYQSDYGDAQRLIEGTLQLLFSASVPCNVVVLSHIQLVDQKFNKEDDPDMHGYPAFGAGKALAPNIPRYFNSVLLLKTTGVGSSAKRKFFTRSQGIIELGNSNPGKVPAELPLETGLADFFRITQGR